MNWFTLFKKAVYGHDSPFNDELDQLLPNYDPYNRKRKSTNDLEDTKNTQFDEGVGGFEGFDNKDGKGRSEGLGETRDFVQMYEDMTRDSLLDKYDEGYTGSAPSTTTSPSGAIMDSPASNGEGFMENQSSASGLQSSPSPLGERATTQRKAKEPDLDTQKNRLPGGTLPPIKPLPRIRRSNTISPLEKAWAFQIKKGRVL